MNYESDEKIIKYALNTIQTPEYDIMMEVKKEIQKPKSSLSFKKGRSILLVACLCLMFSCVVMARGIPSFSKLLTIISPNKAVLLQPVEISSEDKGIKMEVAGAMNDDEMAVIYLTMQDLTGNRIDKTLDIYDYSLTGLNTFNCQMVDYNETTKTATFRMEANGGKKLNGKKVSFRIDSFLNDKRIFDKVETGIKISDIVETDPSQMIPLDMNFISGGGGDLFDKFKSKGTINVLRTDQMNIALPKIDFMYISNMGYIDGRLHIQTKWERDNVDDHGYFYFADKLENKIDNYPSNIYFGTDEEGNTKFGRGYVEYIFDVDSINLNESKLMGYFVSNENYITGNWKTTFKIQSIGEEKQVDCNIKIDSLLVNSISVSPMGITIAGNGECNDLEKIIVCANMPDGSVQTFDSVRSYSTDGENKLKFISSLPLDVSKVKSITINGSVININ